MAASDAMHLAHHGLEVGEGARVIARREGRRSLHEGQGDRSRYGMPLGVESAQAVHQFPESRFVAAGGVGQRGVDFAEQEAGA